MKTQVWVYVVVAVLGVGAGVAIAGVPSSVPRDPTIQSGTDTVTGVGSDVEAGSDATEPTSSADAEPNTSDASTSPSTEDANGTDIESTPVSESPSTSSAPATSNAVESDTAPNRRELDVAIVNGAEVGGAASRVSDALDELGYAGIMLFDGSEIIDFTTVYFAEGFEAPAAELVRNMGMAPDLVRPLDQIPEVGGLESQPLVVYLGRDIVALTIFQ